MFGHTLKRPRRKTQDEKKRFLEWRIVPKQFFSDTACFSVPCEAIQDYRFFFFSFAIIRRIGFASFFIIFINGFITRYLFVSLTFSWLKLKLSFIKVPPQAGDIFSVEGFMFFEFRPPLVRKNNNKKKTCCVCTSLESFKCISVVAEWKVIINNVLLS